ncbi:multidrug efflux pump subunit AcrB [Rhodoblastus acidophilus]|uniref:efflux RND transporter permease subunit n=1 Tax=Rhodoblastus acidophilus TaxID=1074 RepID=UPI002224070A|nr:efflux RND transporter permease subunit [Rhodoblastus acidophilus]MCW2286703.1 multidrug efflux pump subunit AcrB [Rhodoblastus acidophilus]MCW2335514.1 multidrug efflux pump subunit AcrB [Rhodoblastus acidophilus]
MTTPPPEKRAAFNLSSWALDNKPLVIFLMLATLIAGLMSFARLSRNEDPPFTIKTMVVSVSWPGATTRDTTLLLTDRIEQKLEETPWLDHLDSYTRPGESVVLVNLRDDTPPAEVTKIWYQVRKKTGDIAATLPNGVQGPFFDDEFGDTFGIIYGFTAEGFSDRELRGRLDQIRADLLRTRDVGKVNLLGVQEEQIVVEFSPKRLASYGLDVQAVVRAIQAQNAVAPAGVIRLSDEQIGLSVSGALASEASLSSMTLAVNGRFLPLTDLVTIKRIAADPPTPLFRVNGKKALGLAISMSPTGNLLEFSAAVKARMSRIAANLPHGVDMTLVADQGAVVKEAVDGFVKVLAEAIVIVLAVSFVSLGARAGLVVTCSIPLVLAMTFTGMELAGVGLHRVSLGALIIALGLLVDDAMITVEAMVGRLERGWDRHSAASYAWDTTAFPMLTGTLVMIAGFLPVGFAASSAGEYCFSLFMVILIALIASWIVAVLFSPLIGAWILPKTMAAHRAGEGQFGQMLQKRLDQALARPGVTLGGATAALLLACVGATQVQEQFFPPSDRSELLVSLNLPNAASIDATEAEAKKLEALLQDDPDVARFSTYVGAGAIRFYLPMDVLLNNDNIAQTVVVAKSLAARDAIKARLEAAFRDNFPDVVARASPLELGPPVGWPLRYRVTGPDIAKVYGYARDLGGLLAGDNAVRDVNFTAGDPRKTIDIAVDQTLARAIGLSSEDIASALAQIFSGRPITAVRDQNRLVLVKLRGENVERSSLATVANLQITGADGRATPLRQIATLSYGLDDPIIWRRNRQPVITVQADAAPNVQPTTITARLQPAIDAFAAKLPDGYSVELGGAVEEAAKGNDSIVAVLPLMIGVMITLLMLQLRSFSRTALALAMAPFGLIGVVAALLPAGTPMGFVAQLGVIALAGMIIRNAVILIEEVDANIAHGATVRAAVVAATQHRARPILLTASAAILGMFPISQQIFWGPMAYAIIGGLAVATVLTLSMLPAALLLLLSHVRHEEVLR